MIAAQLLSGAAIGLLIGRRAAKKKAEKESLQGVSTDKK